MTERSCGGCTACCDGWMTDAKMNLYPGSGCPHRTAAGCGIYETRPEKPCRTFTCAWMQQPEAFPDELRPDRSGAILITDRDWYGWKVVRAVPAGQEVPPETLEWLRQYAMSKRLPLIFQERHMDGEQFVSLEEKALGPPEFAEAVRKAPGIGDRFWDMSPDN